MENKVARQQSYIKQLSNLYDTIKGMPEPNCTAPYLETQAKIVTDLWSKIDGMHTELFEGTDQEFRDISNYFINDEHNQGFMIYVKALSRIQNKLERYKKAPAPPPTINFPESVVLTTNQNKSNIKLNPIPIPTFSGKTEKWISFRNMFESLVHDSEDFPNLQKFHYLKSSLTGEAERLIIKYNISEENYEVAYKAILERYNNEVKLVDDHIIAIISQPDLTSETSDEIKELLDVTTENIHALNSLKINTDNWDPILLILLVPKLDTASRRLWDLSLKPKIRPTLKEFTDFLEQRFHALGSQQDVKLSIAKSEDKYVKIRANSTFNRNESSNDHNKFNNGHSNHKFANDRFRNHQNYPHSSRQNFHNSTDAFSRPCPVCPDECHSIFSCEKFRKADPRSRVELITCAKLCKRCLRGHKTVCTHPEGCRQCGGNHHTFLHMEQLEDRKSLISTSRQNNQQGESKQPTTVLSNHHANLIQSSQTSNITEHHTITPYIGWDESVLLATAIVLVRSVRDQLFYPFRCLLDQASETNYISEEVAQFLGLHKSSIVADMTGLGGVKTGTAHKVVEFEVGSKLNQAFNIKVQAPVVSKVSNLLPSSYVKKSDWKHMEGLQLADPNFLRPGKVDILLGAPVYGYILLPGLMKSSIDEPVAQNTEFGWILSGPTRSTSVNRSISSFHMRIDLDDQLKKFFEQEELPQVRSWTQEEKYCEEFFEETVRRDEEGRVVVALPFKQNTTLTGTSKGQAISRLMNLESRLVKNKELKSEYVKILEEYGSLNRTTSLGNLNELEIKTTETSNYYMPHHAVFKPESTTTKTRIVFDASAKTTNGVSLNDSLIVGPTLQEDLMSIIMRWRTHKIVFAADIEKMYRQVVVREEDRKYLRFLFRKEINQPIQVYQHNRVTFGVASATYLAVRALKQIAIDGKEKYPKAAEIALRDFYMDDGMSGADSVEIVIGLCKDLRQLLSNGKFVLRKFISNSTEVLESIPEMDRELQLPLEIHTESAIKTLGIRYDPSTDVFQFKVNLASSVDAPTKRSLLSEVSKLFDPLGWLASVIIRAKIFFQALWQEGLQWDQKLPEDLANEWMSFRNELHQLENIQIKRWTGKEGNIRKYELHGFGDASEKAYSAVVYSRIIDHKGAIHITLLAAKTRVAPLKPITLPRLELCGAVLLANLMDNVGKALNIDKSQMHAWSDSTVVLGWIKTHPAKLNTFVANRVVENHNYLNVNQWYHIEGSNNPADCASRGIGPEELQHHDLWWSGPDCLRENKTSWDQELTIPPVTLELKSAIKKSCFLIMQEQGLESYIKDYSSWKKLIRMVALQLRFIHNLRPTNNKITNKLISTEELRQAKNRLIRLHQEKEFSKEIRHLKAKELINTKSVILSLNPYLDEEGILRVGGRLEESNLPHERKHPMILSPGPLADLLISEARIRSLHGGTKLTMNLIKESLWIINLKRNVKKHIARCVTCFRFRATLSEQIMADLPRARVTETSSFTHTSVDYAGFFNVKASNVRSAPIRIKLITVNGEVIKSRSRVPTYKGYIALFVCFATKSIHLEVVSDLTTKAFLAAFDRFTSRRGSPAHMYSDNASTFSGSKNILSEDHENSIVDYEEVAIRLTNDGIKWHFIPPKAPNFGGLHEAGVKSMKHHLKRVVGDTVLTFEELTTITARIEACLNSRPLCPLTEDIDGLKVLTPGHFLIGRPLLAPPSGKKYIDGLEVLTPGHFLIGRPLLAPPSGKSERFEGNLSDRWMLVKKLQRDIWKAWSTDYLNTLQQRYKWKQQRENLRPGNIVLVKEDDVPPTKWPLARVVKVYPSNDSNIRSVGIEVVDGDVIKQFDRPINKLCLLPIIDNKMD